MKKLLAVAALAPLAITAVSLSTPAVAQERVVTTNTRVVTDRHVERHGPGWSNHHARRVCKWKWRNHHRVRVCRTVRW